MPRNFKEAIIFTLLMCSMMVLGMTAWNTFLQGHLSFGAVVAGFPLGFLVALLLDLILVGPLAKKFAFAVLPKLPHHEKRWMKIRMISGSMVLGMVTCMSLFGLLAHGAPITPVSYGMAWISNFVMAVPLNFLIVGPISRFILSKFQKPEADETEVEDFDDDEELPTIV